MVAERQTTHPSLYTQDFVAWVEQTVAQLPDFCPYKLEQVLNPDFLP